MKIAKLYLVACLAFALYGNASSMPETNGAEDPCDYLRVTVVNRIKDLISQKMADVLREPSTVNLSDCNDICFDICREFSSGVARDCCDIKCGETCAELCSADTLDLKPNQDGYISLEKRYVITEDPIVHEDFVSEDRDKCTVDCLVESFQVQPNFNLSMYLGKWYEQKWLPQSYIPPEELFQDYTHSYVLSDNGSVTTYVNGRDPVDLKKCFSYTMLMETTKTPGKLRRTVYINATASMVSDYWVMQTDYTGYAVVYGCREQNVLGQCTYPDSWVWSRTPQLNVAQWTIVNTTIENLCLQGANFLSTQQVNECTVDCLVESFQVQPNFNLSMYLGKWYEQKWFPQSYIPPEERFQDYTHNYVLNNNESVTAYISGSDPVDLKQCFSYTMLLETTSTPGKLQRTIYFNETTSMTSDYWVMKTDYTGYSVVYGCREQNTQGQCTHPDSWIWSRTPQLDRDQWTVVITTIEELCLQEDNFLAMQQMNNK